MFIVAKVVTKLEVLVAKLKVLAALATVSVAISSPVLANFTDISRVIFVLVSRAIDTPQNTVG